MADDYALYRYFDVADVLLYVGRTRDIGSRGSSHIRRSQWMQFAARSSIERYPSLESLAMAERAAVKTEHPVFNRQWNDSPEAIERLRAYLEQAGRLDLMPEQVSVAWSGERPAEWGMPLDTRDDVLDLVHAILTADSPDHAAVRLWALAALSGHLELPRGVELDKLAETANINRVTAYRAKKTGLRRRVSSSAILP